MNWKIVLYVVVAAMCLSACYDESKIVPLKAEDSMLRYEFPQGENSWDQDVVEISEQFGVYLIYKGFKEADFNRSWTGAMTGAVMHGYDLTDEQAELSIKFMKNQVFAHLNKKIVERVLPMYWYMIYDYNNTTTLMPGWTYKVAHRYNFDGLDFWGLCLFYGDPCPLTGSVIKVPVTPEDFRIRRDQLLGKIFERAFEKGNIGVPAGFGDGIDYRTAVLYEEEEVMDKNFYITRGFPGVMSAGFGSFSPVYEDPTPMDKHFVEFIKFAIRYTKAEYEAMWPSSTYPLVHEKRQLVIDYMKNTHEIDLEAIALLKERW